MKLTGSRCRCGGCSLAFLDVAAFDVHRHGKWGERGCLGLGDTLKQGLEWQEGFLGRPGQLARMQSKAARCHK